MYRKHGLLSILVLVFFLTIFAFGCGTEQSGGEAESAPETV